MSTERHAMARIINQTGRDITTASIVHKYSDNYKNIKTMGSIPNGATSSEYLEVDYNTGAFTTGRDWWLVTWQYDDKAVYFTDPNNFRDIIDSLEQNIFRTVPSSFSHSLADDLFNNASTEGFKQHILRSEDENQFVDFILKPDGNVVIKSPSGESETVYTSKEAPVTA